MSLDRCRTSGRIVRYTVKPAAGSSSSFAVPMLFTLFLLAGTSAMAQVIEEPEYAVLYKLGDVELREYMPTVQAVTTLANSSATTKGFRRLASFISGGNENSQSIAMTAPVQETLGVNQPEMAFTMPRELVIGDLPAPDDGNVRLVELPGRYIAAISFSGWATEGRIAKYAKLLKSTLYAEGVEATGPLTLSQFNPPWTAPFLRRNEIVVEISAQAQLDAPNEVYIF
jgi:hypothetical protein